MSAPTDDLPPVDAVTVQLLGAYAAAVRGTCYMPQRPATALAEHDAWRALLDRIAQLQTHTAARR